MTMDDKPKPDFIERAQGISKNWLGEEWKPDQLVQEFHLYGHAKRAAALDEFDAELRDGGPITSSPNELRRHAELYGLRRSLDEVHHALRKVGR
jgi:hypothetical protein